MAFDIANFGPLGGQSRRGKAPMWWTYTTTDAHTTVDGAGYFNSGTAYAGVYNHLEIGDVIYVCVTSGGALSTAGVHVVKDKASGTVDVTNVTAFTVTDSD